MAQYLAQQAHVSSAKSKKKIQEEEQEKIDDKEEIVPQSHKRQSNKPKTKSTLQSGTGYIHKPLKHKLLKHKPPGRKPNILYVY